MQVPSFIKRYILVNLAPGSNSVPSGIVPSATKPATSHPSGDSVSKLSVAVGAWVSVIVLVGSRVAVSLGTGCYVGVFV